MKEVNLQQRLEIKTQKNGLRRLQQQIEELNQDLTEAHNGKMNVLRDLATVKKSSCNKEDLDLDYRRQRKPS